MKKDDTSEVLIVRPKSKTVSSEEDFRKNREAFYKKKVGELQNNIFSSYLQKRRDLYQIRINSELYDKIIKNVISRYR